MVPDKDEGIFSPDPRKSGKRKPMNQIDFETREAAASPRRENMGSSVAQLCSGQKSEFCHVADHDKARPPHE